MLKEAIPRQYDMFSGELVDARSDYQKKSDQERNTPQQMLMFKTPEMVEFGKRPPTHSDWLQQASAPPLILEMQDTRTPEEIERDLIKEAEKRTIPLFKDQPLPLTESLSKQTSETKIKINIIFDAQAQQQISGLREKLRVQQLSGRVRQHVA